MRDGYQSVNCNLCGADNYSIVYEARYNEEKDANLAFKFRSSGDEILIDQVVRCRHCGLLYVNPVLAPDLILEGYRREADEVFVSQSRAREKTFVKCFTFLEKYSPRPGKILDVGTAAGAFLYVAKLRGWEVAGCEPNEWLCQWAKKHYGLEVTPGTIFEQRYKQGAFDVVTLWDVLEHTPDPKAVLRECHRVLKPSGILVINFPDAGSWIAKAMARRWVFWLSVHLFYFNRKTISLMLKETGFKSLKAKPHFQFLEFAYIFQRAEAYIGPLAGTLRKVIKFIGFDKLVIPYWMGQTLVIAKKERSV